MKFERSLKVTLLILLFLTEALYGKSFQDVNSVFPKNFLWGTAIAEWQNSGSDNLPNCNWARFEKKPGSIEEGQMSGKSVDHWNRYEEDIQIMKDLGLNSFRFSIDWSKIEPQEGKFDEEALKHYEDMCDSLLKAGISPMATLHHFTHPLWFEKLGAFEKSRNIQYFVRFSKKVFERLHNKIQLWCTINEVAIHPFTGYFLGIHAPGKMVFKSGFKLVGVVLKNLLRAHVETYKALKAMPGGEQAQIGIVHNVLKFAPRYSLEPLELGLTKFLTWLTNDLVMNFLKTGKFHYKLPLAADVFYEEPFAPKSFDFIGLNYYATSVLGFNTNNIFGPTCFPGQIMGDMYLPIDPKGFAKAIDDVAEFNVPIYITENGIADARDDRRERFFKSFLGVVKEALKKGCDIRGYYYWTLVDNFEWQEGRTKKFGLCDDERNVRDSVQYLKEFIAAAS